jgi:REP element-mobilizing transposase RayT
VALTPIALGMTQPRMSIPGATYLITRTTVMSLFLLTPSKIVNQIMEYCIAIAASGRGILIHAVSIESNHFHLVVTDTEGRLSDFMQELNRTAARCLLEYYRERFPNRRLDAVWTRAQSFCATVLLTPNAILDEIVYTLTNPVKDGLVRDYRKWPGFNTRPGDWRHGTRSVRRPRQYFKRTPEEITYRVCAPSKLGDSIEHAIQTVELHIRTAQEQAAIELAAQGRGVMSINAILATDPLDAPRTPRAVGKLIPVLAAGGDRDALSAAKAALQTFRRAYREAWEEFKAKARATFPGGTLLMRTRFAQPCAALDACWCLIST